MPDKRSRTKEKQIVTRPGLGLLSALICQRREKTGKSGRACDEGIMTWDKRKGKFLALDFQKKTSVPRVVIFS